MSQWPYIREPRGVGNPGADAAAFLRANAKEAIARHCAAVAETSVGLCRRFGLDCGAAEAAALLHDISGVVRPQDMMAYAVQCGWRLDEAEKKYPFLLHQRLSALMARGLFGVRDRVVLSAIACHATLKQSPSPYDMVLFLADKLSWDQAGTPPFFEAVCQALHRSLEEACLAYIDFVMENGMILCPHQQLLEARRWLRERMGS